MADTEQRQAAPYTTASPIFDVPEFPALRRIAPLPKRRRTIDMALTEDAQVAQDGQDRLFASETQTTPDELANALSASMALNPYYMPLFRGPNGTGPELFKEDIDSRHVNPTELLTGTNSLNNGYVATEEREDGDREESRSYADHLSQPGNTKKRKVPVAAHARGDDAAPESGEDTTGNALPVDHGVAEIVNVVPPIPPPLDIPPKKGKLSRATQAGLQFKEMLKSRKHQLAEVLRALSHNDSLAVDQALATTYPFARRNQCKDRPPVRLSRRPQRKKSRTISAATKKRLSASSIDENAKVPECVFSFICDSPTSERVRAMSKEVAYLQSQFDAEFARQATKAAEAARETALLVQEMQKTRREELAQRRARIAGRLTGPDSESAQKASEKMVATSKSKVKKKKKRSALANAANPHHLRNYVPSRLPNSGPLPTAQATANAQNYLGPAALRFLSAQLPRRRRRSGAAPPTASLTNAEDEWICPFCEYSLFYGDDHSFRRAVRQRKKILSRRRRALERAAATASGRQVGVTPPGPVKEEPVTPVTPVMRDEPADGDGCCVSSQEQEQEQDRDRDKFGDRGRLLLQ